MKRNAQVMHKRQAQTPGTLLEETQNVGIENKMAAIIVNELLKI